jgi:hypothetical protein
MESHETPDVTDRTTPLSGAFCPPAGDLEPFLAVILEIGGPTVDLDGLVVPRIGPATSGVDLSAETSEAVAATAPGTTPPLYPGRHVRYRMEVAYFSDIRSLPDSEVVDYIQSSEKSTVVSYSAGTMRYRGLERLQDRGRKAWAEEGAWPWFLYEVEAGRLPQDWRDDRAVAEALRSWHREAILLASHELMRFQARVARAKRLHQDI